MIQLLENKTGARVIVFALLLTILAWLIPANVREADAATTSLQNPRTAADGTVTWDCVWFGHYPQTSDGNGGFNNDPIKWRVLSVDGDEALLLADKNLDCKEYNEEYADVTWETSTSRNWLNGSGTDDFLGKAFTGEEQGAIYEKTVQNPENPQHGTAGGNATSDKVFFLSIDEATNPSYGFPSDYEENPDTRKALNTDYTRSRGACEYAGIGWWWLRSPGAYAIEAACVHFDGFVVYGEGEVFDNSHAVRPALRLNLSSDLWSYAGTVSSDKYMEDNTQIAYAVTGGKIYFDKITGTITSADWSITQDELPATIEGVAVTCIGSSAFFGRHSLTSITIPDSVTSIGQRAFMVSGLTSITIPSGVDNIGDYAFGRCENLNSVTIQDGVKSLGEGVFWNCGSLASITIPDSVTSIGQYAFYGSGLTSITIPSGVDNIGDYAFGRCENLNSVTIQDGVKSLGAGAFESCGSLNSVTIPASVTNIGDCLFGERGEDYKGVIKGYTGSVAEAYAKENGITFVSIGEVETKPTDPTEPSDKPTDPTKPTDPDPTKPADPSVTPTNPTKPTPVTPVDPPTKPTNPSVDPTEPSVMPTDPTKPEDPTESAKPEPPTIEKPTNQPTAPAQVKPGSLAQDQKSNASYIVTKNGTGASKNTVTYKKAQNNKKANIVIPATVKIAGKTYRVTKIASNAFKSNSKIKSVKIGANIQTIGANAFNKCSNLKSITIPGKVTTIEKGAFANCKNLKSITIKTTKLIKSSVGKNAFKGIPAKAVIKVPKGKVNAYKKLLRARGVSKKARIK